MPIFDAAEIILDEPRCIFYSGQMLSGCLQFTTIEPVSFSVIKIQFCGEAEVAWSEQQEEEYDGVERTVTINYGGKEEYFNYVDVLAGGNGVTHLQPGGHSFKFKYQIPSTAPSSFKGDRGSVLYSVIVYLEYLDPRCEREELMKEFEVVAPFDLNHGDPEIKTPTELEFEVNSGSCCFSSPVTLKISTPYSGYCPGQTIPFTVAAETTVEIKKLVIELIKKVRFQSTMPRSDYITYEVLASLKKGPIIVKTLTCDLVVPDMIATTLDSCGIIDVGYFMKIKIKMAGCSDKLIDESELCIGLVPLKETVDGVYTHPMADSLPTSPIPDQTQHQPTTITNAPYPINSGPVIGFNLPDVSQGLPNVYPDPKANIPMANMPTTNMAYPPSYPQQQVGYPYS